MVLLLSIKAQYNYMKSKRKQVNKYNFRSHQESKESQIEQYLRRTSGIKPFQLAKLRQAQRFSMDLAHANNQILHKRIGSNNLYDEEKEAYLDLIIKQKLLVDGSVNQKLESERKKIVSLKTEDREVEQEKMPPASLESNPQVQEENQGEQCKVYTCQSPQSQNIMKNALQTFSASAELRQPSQEEQRIDEAKNEIRLMKQKALPPFSFTSTKWRSKSQILQVDKWKQKYGKELHHNRLKVIQKTPSLTKMESNKALANRIKEVRSHIHSLQSQKVSLPILRKQKQLESKVKIFKLASKSAKHEEEIKIKDETDSYFLLTRDSLKKKSSQSTKKKHSQEAQKGEIAIKKMYETSEETEQPIIIEVNTEDTEKREEPNSPTEKTQKSKKKKSKFPQIQITTFYSSKEQEIQKRRVKLESIQRIARQWRYQPPKKVFLQKMMEEIPERWEYGDSRGSSRGGQVDNYLKIKEEEAKFQKSQKDIELQEAQVHKGEQVVQIKH